MDKILQDFLKFEVDESLFQRRYRGIHYWQTIRFVIGDTVNRAFIRPVYVKRKKNLKWFDGKLHMFINAIFDVKNWHRLKEADILYFDQCAYRNVSGGKKDPYFDYFGFEKSYSVQRCFYLNNYSGRKYEGKGVGTAIAELKSYFIIFFSKRFPFIADKKEERFIHRLCDRIDLRFQMRIDPEQVICGAKKASILYSIYHKYYKKLLKRINPKVIFVVAHYGCDNLWPLYPMAKEMGIPVIELQHGTVINHMAYSYMDISDIGKRLPDYFFSYGEFWEGQINLPVCMKPYPVGNPFLENRYRYYADKNTDDKKIVFYSDRWEMNGKKLMELALSISNKYHTKGYKIFFKIHPGEYSEWKEKYKELKNGDKIKVLTDEIELYKLLSMARHHIGVCSTVFYEALIFDVNIYILEPENGVMFEMAKPLIDLKRACFIHDADDFGRSMESCSKLHGEFEDRIWKKNSRKNAHERLQEILSERFL